MRVCTGLKRLKVVFSGGKLWKGQWNFWYCRHMAGKSVTSRSRSMLLTGWRLKLLLYILYKCMKVTNKMQLYRLIYFSLSALHVLGVVFAHHQEHLTVFTVSGSIHSGCCRLVSWMSCDWTVVHQPAETWVNTARYCKYSQVLLMMGENIARHMSSWQRKLN